MTTRLLIVAALLIPAQLGVIFIRRAYVPARIELPREPLSSLPLQLGNWMGEDIEMDDRLFDAVGADAAVNRIYRDPSGREMVVHVAVFTDTGVGPKHPPEVCYTVTGWSIVRQDSLAVRAAGAPGVSARVLEMEQEGVPLTALFWYQLGEESFVDYDGHRSVRRNFFGQESWPAVVKILFHTRGTYSATGPMLQEFAEHIYAWSGSYE